MADPEAIPRISFRIAVSDLPYAMAGLTCGDCRQVPELRDAMPYVMQFKAHEMVYEYNRVVVRLFEGR